MIRIKTLGFVVFALLFTMCGRNQSSQTTQADMPGNKFAVVEVVQTRQYTYLQVLEGLEIKWVAIPQQEVAIGETLYYDTSLEMTNFHSKELDRTFESIYFINNISRNSPAFSMPHGQHPGHSGIVSSEPQTGIQIDKGAGEVTIGQIFDNPGEYAGREIEIRGIVVKVNEGIMGTNWIHLQDGTIGNGKFDLTITSDDLPLLNQETVFKGIITLNKDFGAGYVYDVIMEKGSLIRN